MYSQVLEIRMWTFLRGEVAFFCLPHHIYEDSNERSIKIVTIKFIKFKVLLATFEKLHIITYK